MDAYDLWQGGWSWVQIASKYGVTVERIRHFIFEGASFGADRKHTTP